MSRGILSGGFCPGGFCPGGFCPDTVSVLGQGGFCPGGFCPGDFVWGGFVRGDFVLIPFQRNRRQLAKQVFLCPFISSFYKNSGCLLHIFDKTGHFGYFYEIFR